MEGGDAMSETGRKRWSMSLPLSTRSRLIHSESRDRREPTKWSARAHTQSRSSSDSSCDVPSKSMTPAVSMCAAATDVGFGTAAAAPAATTPTSGKNEFRPSADTQTTAGMAVPDSLRVTSATMALGSANGARTATYGRLIPRRKAASRGCNRLHGR